MKILMCNKFNFIHGGAERYLFDLARGLQDIGCEVAHFSTKDPRNFDAQHEAFFMDKPDYDKELCGRLMSKFRTARDIVFSFEAQEKVERLIDSYHPQVAHVHNIYHQISPSILHVFKRRRIPVVMTLHDYKLICPNYKLFVRGNTCDKCHGRAYYRCLLGKCIKDSWHASLLGMVEAYVHAVLKSYDVVDLFMAPSRFMADKILAAGISPKKVIFLPCSVDLSDFSLEDVTGKYVVYFGRLLSEKGLVTLLKSLKICPDVKIKIIGDGPFRNALEKLVSEQELSQVEILGHRSRPELNMILREALCVIVPSEWPEPMGLVIYEAFAAGKCVIASDVGGISELIEDGVNGLIFQAGNADDLAHKIRQVVDHPQQARLWGRNGYLKIRQYNDLKTHVIQMKEIYSRYAGG